MIALALAAGWAGLILALGWCRRPVRRAGALVSVHPPCAEGPRRVIPARIGGWAFAVAAGAGALVLAGPGVALALAGAVVVSRRVRRLRTVRRESAERQSLLPEAIDLLVLATAAGFTHRAAIDLVAERGPPPLRPAFADVATRTRTGEALAAALPRLTATVGEQARGLVRAIVVAERDGVPVRAVLTSLADDARRQRRQRLEASVRRLPVRLTVPLACCSLPAFVVLTVVPLLATGLQRLGPIPN